MRFVFTCCSLVRICVGESNDGDDGEVECKNFMTVLAVDSRIIPCIDEVKLFTSESEHVISYCTCIEYKLLI